MPSVDGSRIASDGLKFRRQVAFNLVSGPSMRLRGRPPLSFTDPVNRRLERQFAGQLDWLDQSCGSSFVNAIMTGLRPTI
jgi:hypothetical protein